MKNVKLNWTSIALVALCLAASITLILTGHKTEGGGVLAVVVGLMLPQPMKMESDK